MPLRPRRPLALAAALLLSVALAACGASIHRTQRPTATVPSTPVAARPPAGIATVQLYPPMGEYTEDVETILDRLRSQLDTLDAQLSARNVAGAEAAWLAAHVSWLEIGQDDGAYGAFGTLGNEIDGTADGDVGGAASPSFTGFHRVEYELYERHDVGAATAAAKRLTGAVDSIRQSTINADLPLTPVGLDAWVLRCHEILEDALRDTLSQNDDYGSHTALASVSADVSATREMLAVLSGLIAPRAPGLVQAGEQDLSAIDAALNAAERAGGAGVPVSALPQRTRQRLDASVDAALETLAPVSELMQISNASS